MNREWKPGDILTNSAGVWLLYELQGGDVWAISPNGNVPGDMLTHPRPLALIDPESAADVTELVRLFWAHGTDDGDDPHAMQAALREFANPTPPRCTASLSVFYEDDSIGHECREPAGHDGPHTAAGASWSDGGAT